MRSESLECRWSQPRIPLLAGGELYGADRRRAERHLLLCPTCRQHLKSAQHTLNLLRVAAADNPAPNDAPSLWPAVAQQLNDSRRPEMLAVDRRRAAQRALKASALAAAVLLLAIGSAWLWPTARQYRVSVSVNRVPPVRIHRVTNRRPVQNQSPWPARRASLIRPQPAEQLSAQNTSTHRTAITN